MKVLPIFLFVLLMVSCGQDDSSNLSNTPTLVGTWTLSGLSYDGISSTTDEDGSITTTDFDGDAEDFDITLIFEENPEVYTSVGSYTIIVNSVVFGQDVNQELVFNSFLGDGTWEQNNGVLTTFNANNGETLETNILQLSDDSMILDFETTNIMMVQGLLVEQVISGVASFKK